MKPDEVRNTEKRLRGEGMLGPKEPLLSLVLRRLNEGATMSALAREIGWGRKTLDAWVLVKGYRKQTKYVPLEVEPVA